MSSQRLNVGTGLGGGQPSQRRGRLQSRPVTIPVLRFSCLTVLLLTFSAWLGVPHSRSQEVTFGPSIRVDDDTTGRNQHSPSLAVDPEGNIYVAWQDLRSLPITGRLDIYFSKSTDGGSTWSANVKVNDDDPPHPGYPSLDVDADGNIYVAWEDDRSGVNIYFAMSTDGGETWTNPNIKVNDNIPAGHYNPSLAADDSGRVYVTWSDDRNDISDIYFAMSTDKGNTWTTPNVRVNDSPTDMQLMSCVCADGSGTTYAVWCDWREAIGRIYFSKSTDGGLTWSANVPVSDTTFLSPGYPSAEVDGEETIYVVWDDGKSGDLDIYFGMSTDGGVTWTEPNIRVNDSAPRHQYMPSLGVDQVGNVYVAWMDFREGIDDCHVYFALSTDRGNTWTDPNIRVNDSLTWVAQYPSVDVGNDGQIYAAFKGMQDSISYDIYFAKGTVTGVEETSDARCRIPDARLLQNRPNPCGEFTIINYQLSEPLHISLRVYDIAGRLVKILVDGQEEPGDHIVCWDGRDENGRKVPSGLYFYRLSPENLTEVRKLVIVR